MPLSSPAEFDSLFEPFVDADVAARFLSLSRKHILKLAIHGVIPAHPLGPGQRKTWRFLLSELRDWLLTNANSTRLMTAAMVRARFLKYARGRR